MKSKHRARIFSRLLIEGMLLYLCGVAAIFLRFGQEATAVLTAQQGWLKTLLVTSVVQASFYLFDLYDFRQIRQSAVLLSRVTQGLAIAAVALALVFYAWPQMMLGRGVFFLSLGLMLPAMMFWRSISRWMVGHPRLAERVLILGTEPGAVALAREVLERRETGYEIVGFVGDDPAMVGRSLINPCVIGTMPELEQVVRQYRADRIVIALADRRGRLPLDLLLTLKLRDDVQVEESATFYERLTGKIGGERLRPSQLLFADTTRWARLYKRARRPLDVTMALVGLALSSPLILLTALAVKLDSRGPVFYSQQRTGLHNQPFHIFKFRSMRTDAEANGPVWAGKSDSRVTRVGRVIRKLRIDELPQLFNILRGDMSLIGPRPERPVFVEQLEQRIPYYSERHLIKPGLTGWAQVCYPYGASFEDAWEKHQYDLYYIKNQSPMLDAIILLETVRLVLFGRFSR